LIIKVLYQIILNFKFLIAFQQLHLWQNKAMLSGVWVCRIIFFLPLRFKSILMDNRDNLLGVLATLFKWKKQILKVILLAGIGTAAISFFFLDDYYRASTVFYVSSPDLFKPEQMFGTSNKDMEYFGTDGDLDRVLTIAESNELYDFLIKTFDLYKHYDIDSTKQKAPFKVREHLQKLYEVKKTKFDAIELSVEDTDREFAARMANTAREKIDEKEKTLLSINGTLTQLRQNSGVIDPEQQTEAVTKSAVEAGVNYARSKAKLDALRKMSNISKDTIALLEATVKGYEGEVKESNATLKRYNDGYNGVLDMKNQYERESEQVSKDKQRYLQLRIAYSTKISAVSVIEPAAIPIVKERPKRSIIIVSAMLIAFIFSVVGVLLADNYKDVSWKELTQN
jgi:tyrosine-protein kinase Etk/Wzc